jgi:class 3 adenylate cyclase
MERRLAVILAADVKGRSRLMGEDEPGTLKPFKTHGKRFGVPEIAARGGRVVKPMGNEALAS